MGSIILKYRLYVGPTIVVTSEIDGSSLIVEMFFRIEEKECLTFDAIRTQLLLFPATANGRTSSGCYEGRPPRVNTSTP